VSRGRGRAATVAALALLLLGAAGSGRAFPVHGAQTVLPEGSELDEDAIDLPTEIFHSEAIEGRKSYLVSLGDMAFNSPLILGGPARRAGISCGTCHVQGASNPKLFVPGMSTRPGNFDTTGSFFNPPADDGVLDPVTIPSLRGARFLAPYGHDGRIASLREFVRNVIVNEFAGPEPSPSLVDAIVVYIQDIDFLPDPLLGPGGKLTEKASDAARRGEALFAKPFPGDPQLSCAACHLPSAAFVDHRQHDVGSGGLFKTPTLINANFNAPYFHDGRYDTYDQVVAYFDQSFKLGLTAQQRQDLVAYLEAIGDGTEPTAPDDVDTRMQEIEEFSSPLAIAIPAHDTPIIMLTADSVGGIFRDFSEHYPDRFDATVSGGLEERAAARAALKEMVLSLRKIAMAASAGDFDAATAEYAAYNARMEKITPVLKAGEPWSLFNKPIHDAHYASLRRMIETANQPSH
jgi:di-heme cytochrome c peroxidase